jgi:penicillin-binding protein 1A
VLLLGSLLFVCGVALAAMGVVGWVVAVADSAPNINQLKPRIPGQVSTVYAADGSLLGYIASDVLRTIVPQNQQPQLLRRATVAIEDRRFWQHGGVDYQGIIRAGLKDLFDGQTVQGGSTLTMQLIGNVYLPNRIRQHHDIKYKIVQAKLANELESNHSRDWILTQYLNDVDYGTVGGQSAIGVGAAAHVFFDKPVQRLDLAQTALLAGLPQAPSVYNPFLHPALARQRRADVLRAMVQARYITQEQADAADARPLEVHRNFTYAQKNQPYVFDYVKQELIKTLGQQAVDRGGLKVYTTIDLHRQTIARNALMANEGSPGDPAAALVSVDPTNGHILAMAQNTTYGTAPGQTTFDYATQSHRQTGSSFKPFVLMTLIHDENGDPNQTFYTSKPLPDGWLPGYPTYSVHTAEMSYQGTISITKAMTDSDNTVFAQLGVDLGMDRVDAIAHEMGITSPLDGFPAEAIGGLRIGVSPLEMSDAYATLANGGQHIKPTILNRIVFPDGSARNVGSPTPKRIFSYGETYAADQVLKTVITSGTGTAANYGCPASGKTGTTSNYTDAWFVGYTPQLSTAVWVGYPNATTSMNDVNGLGPGFGGTLAAPIWKDYMEYASEGYCSDFQQPTVPWHGEPYFGKHSALGHASQYHFGPYNYGTTPPAGTGTGTGAATTTTGTGTGAYTNTTLYANPPQGTPTTGTKGTGKGNGNGNGNTNSPPPGFGTGQQPSTGGAGVHH